MDEVRKKKSKQSSWIARTFKFSTVGTQYLGASLSFYLLAYVDYRSPLGGPGTGGVGRILDAIRYSLGSRAPEIVFLIVATFCLMMAFNNREK